MYDVICDFYSFVSVVFVCKIVPAGVPYFYAEIPGGVKLYSRISRGFPLQFGR